MTNTNLGSDLGQSKTRRIWRAGDVSISFFRTPIVHFHRGFRRCQAKEKVPFFFLIRHGSETSISGVFKHKNRQGKPGLDPNLQYQIFTLFRDFRCKVYHSTHLSHTSNKNFSTMKQYFFLNPKIKKSVFDEMQGILLTPPRKKVRSFWKVPFHSVQGVVSTVLGCFKHKNTIGTANTV